MYKIQKHEDTGWEHLDGARLKGRIVNGIATLVFESFDFEGTEGALETIFILPEKYKPTANIFFNLTENSLRPNMYVAYVNGAGLIRANLLHSSNNVIGTVSYPVD